MKVYEFGFGFPPRLIGIQFIKDANGKSKLRFIGRKRIKEEESLGGGLPGDLSGEA